MTGPDDELAEAVRASLRHQADRITLTDEPFDPDRVAARRLGDGDELAGRRARGRSLAAVAAGIVLLLIAAGVLVTRGSRDEASVHTVSPPAEEGLRHVLPPLAPEGVEWWVESYQPNAERDRPPQYEVAFTRNGFQWRLLVGANGPEPVGDPVVVGDRSVNLFSFDTNRVTSLASWWDPSGQLVQLEGRAPGYAGLPTTEEVTAIVELIHPVDDEAWLAALNPPRGAVYPPAKDPTVDFFMAMASQPLHLGIDAPPGRARLSVWPWRQTQSELDVEGYAPAAFRLVTDRMHPEWTMEVQSGDPIAVRGTEGILDLEAGNLPGEEGSTDKPGWTGTFVRGYNRSITWSEGGSTVQLTFLDGPTVDEALAVASSLVVLDDEQWSALLFPERRPGEITDDTTPTTIAPDVVAETTTTTSVTVEVPPDDAPVSIPEPEGPIDSSAVRTRLELDTSSVAGGGTIEGRVVVNNDTGAPIQVISCMSVFHAGLQNDRLFAVPGSRMCATGFDIPAGESTWAVTIAVTYAACTQDPGSATESTPLCTSGPTPGIPPLPPGRYSTVVIVPEGFPVPAPVEITVT